MPAMRLPAFQFYPSDWMTDPGVRALTHEERGIWMDLLCIMHECEDRGKLALNGLAYPSERLAAQLSIPQAKLQATLNALLQFNVASRDSASGIIFNRRMVRDEAKRLGSKELSKIRSEAGRKGGLASASKRTKPPSKMKQKEAASSPIPSPSPSSKKKRTPLELARQIASVYKSRHDRDNPNFALPTPYTSAMFEFRDALVNNDASHDELFDFVTRDDVLGKTVPGIVDEIKFRRSQNVK